MQLNILIVMLNLKPGGSERVISNFANWVVNNTKSRINILVTEKLNSIYELDSKINILEGNIYGKGFKKKIEREKYIKTVIKKLKPNIIFTLFANNGIYSYFAKEKNSVLIASERANFKIRNLKTKLRYLFYAKISDGMIFQTERIKNQYPKWIIKNKSIVIHNPIANHAIEKKDNNFKKSKTIIAMGRLYNQKGFDILIKAFSLVSQKHPEYKLIILGEGKERETLQNLINDLNLNDKVTLPGVKNNSIDYIAKSEIFVLSSRYEGMPNVLMEAMCIGTACIATDCEAGPAELIENYNNGILVPMENEKILAEKIIELIENPDLRKKLGKNAKKIIENHQPDDIFKQYYNFMKKIYLKKIQNKE